MVEFRHILCPIDFSDTSLRALTFASTLASRYAAEVEVLHVVPVFDGAFTHSDAVPPSARRDPASREEITRELHCAIAAAGALHINTRAHAQEGRPFETILSRARALPADLLVMGTHGRSGFNRLLLGSVTEKVVRTALCPVLTVPPGASPTADAPATLQRILCPIDYSPSALKALQYALELGRKAGGHVTVLNALEYMDSDHDPQLSPWDPSHEVQVQSRHRRQHLIDHAHKRLHAQLAQQATTGCDIKEVVEVDRAYKAILRHAAEASVDVIVMGAQGTGGLELMLYGSNTQHVVRAAICPVMTVRA